MASVAFLGTTIWNDTDNTGMGRIEYVQFPAERFVQQGHMPRSTGLYAKELGTGGSPVHVMIEHLFASQSAAASFVATINGLRNTLSDIGSLVTPYGTVTNCRLIGVVPVSSPKPIQIAGTLYQSQWWNYLFVKEY